MALSVSSLLDKVKIALSMLILQLTACLNEELTKIYCAEIINALEFIHSNNLMHRDLKPENIMLAADYHLKLVMTTNH
jgi:serine/threonine protein kinase